MLLGERQQAATACLGLVQRLVQVTGAQMRLGFSGNGAYASPESDSNEQCTFFKVQAQSARLANTSPTLYSQSIMDTSPTPMFETISAQATIKQLQCYTYTLISRMCSISTWHLLQGSTLLWPCWCRCAIMPHADCHGHALSDAVRHQ